MTKSFSRFARKARIEDAVLWHSAVRADSGVIDADLGGGVIKLRIARKGEERSGGSRAIVLFRLNVRAVFAFGFEKKDLGNISSRDLEAFRELAQVILGYSNAEIAHQAAAGSLIEITEPEGA